MTEDPHADVRLTQSSFQFLRQQVLLFQGFALGLAHELGLEPEEAGRRFWQGLSKGRPPRRVSEVELEQIAEIVAEDMRLIYGDAAVERTGNGWRVTATAGQDDRRALKRWGASLEYAVRWLAEVQRHEGDQIQTEWTTRLEADRIVQELVPRE